MKFVVQQKFTNSCTAIHIQMKKVLTLIPNPNPNPTGFNPNPNKGEHGPRAGPQMAHRWRRAHRQQEKGGRQPHILCGLERNEGGAVTSHGRGEGGAVTSRSRGEGSASTAAEVGAAAARAQAVVAS